MRGILMLAHSPQGSTQLRTLFIGKDKPPHARDVEQSKKNSISFLCESMLPSGDLMHIRSTFFAVMGILLGSQPEAIDVAAREYAMRFAAQYERKQGV